MPAEAITVEEALRAYTLAGASSTFDEARQGSLTPGMWADFAVLSDNPLSAPPEQIDKIEVHRTVSGGETVYQNRGWAAGGE